MYTGLNIEREGLVFGYDADNRSVRSYKGKPLLYDTGDWSTDLTGGTSAFAGWAGGNTRTTSTDPWGNQSVMWKSSTENSSASRGGLYGNTVPIDNTKLYRVSYWENRVTNNNATYGRYYLGLHGYGSVNGVGNLGSGTANTNPYFWSTGRTGVPINTWVLVVGHIHPHKYPSTAEHVDSGRWTVDGVKYGNIGTDYKWLPQTTTGRPRSLAIYQGNVSGMIHHTIHPRMDLCDGTEPSLSDLIEGKHRKLINIKSRQEINLNNMSFDSTGHPVFDGTDDKIVIPADSFSNIGTGDFTIDLVFKNTKTSNYNHFFSVKDQYHFAIKMQNTSVRNIYVYRTGALSTYDAISAYAPSTTDYYHLVCKREGDNIELYLNGVSKGTKSGWGSIDIQNDTETTSIGTHGTSSEFTGGEIPVVKLYNKALSAEEIKQNYNAYKNRFNL